MTKITAVVVTYNRLNWLGECIKSIREQTVALDSIIVINNGSTDGTYEWLKSQEGLIVFNQSNLGSAGGFKRGIEEAYAMNSDWIWVMDDDVEPYRDCLENQLRFSDISGCIHPHKHFLDNVDFEWEHYFDLARGTRFNFDNLSFKNGKEFCFVNVACFEGMLISREVVSKAGFPDERFFIGNDDTIYGLTISKYTNILYTNKALLLKKKLSTDHQMTPFYIYYIFRNFHLVKEYKKEFFPRLKNYEINLNQLISVARHFHFILSARQLTFKTRLNLLKSIYRGIRDSSSKKTGI